MATQFANTTQNGYANGGCSLNKSHDVDREVRQIDPKMVCALLSSVPEMRSIEELLDQKCYSLHEDSKLNLFADLFRQILYTNETVFSSRTNQEKINILYNFHVGIVIRQLSASDKFDTLIRKIFDQLKEPFKTPQVKETVKLEVENMLKNRFLRLHSCFLSFAISFALELPFEDTVFSNEGAMPGLCNLPDTSI